MHIWLILNLGISTVVAKDYVAVSGCPSGPLSWQIQEESKKCQDPTPVYICAAVANSPAHGEICSNLDRDIPSGTCVVLNNSTHELDFVACTDSSKCPDTEYSHKELYKWPICYGDFYSTDGEVPAADNSEETGESGIVTGVIIVGAMVLIGALVCYCIYRHTDGWKWKCSRDNICRNLWRCPQFERHETRNRKVIHRKVPTKDSVL